MIERLPRSAWLFVITVLVAGASSPCQQNTKSLSHTSQFHHTLWSADSGIGAVYDIHQELDGFLWIQTSTGVFRFDGVRFQTAAELLNDDAQSRRIDAVLPSSFGGVWFTTANSGLLRWKEGHLTAYPDPHCTGRIFERRDGTLWVASRAGLFRVQGSQCRQVGPDEGYPGGEPAGIMTDQEGDVWVKTWQGELFSLSPGQSKFVLSPYGKGPTRPFAFFHEAPDHSIWLSDDYGLRQVRGEMGVPPASHTAVTPSRSPDRFGDFDIAADGSAWIITDKTLRRTDHIEGWQSIHQLAKASGEIYALGAGLSSDAIWAIYVDREGNVWVGTDAGLEQLRRVAISTPQLPISQEHELGVASGDQGSIWTGSLSLPLTHLAANGTSTSFPRITNITSIRQDRNGIIWVAGERSPYLQRSSPDGFKQVHYPEEKEHAVVFLAVDRNSELWISLRQLGTFHLTGGGWRSEDGILGKEPTDLGVMTDDAAGNVWFAFRGKLVRWDGAHYSYFVLPGGLLGLTASTMMVRKDHVWLTGDDGVGLFTQGHLRLLYCKDKGLPGRVSGILETSNGDLWMNGPSGVTHVSADEVKKWIDHPSLQVSANRLDQQDGLPGFSAEGLPYPSLMQSPDGIIWFGTTKGIAWLNPAMLDSYRNHLPPPVVISSILANGHRDDGLRDMALPATTKNLQIDYTALSFTNPERVEFRYKLDGVDVAWQDAGTRRQAFYNGLSPGSYHFHVIASNNDGVWNETGATLLFTVKPAFYQTWWFRSLLAVLAAVLAWFLIRLRIRILLRELQGRLTARLEERERIARELHDTLLQGLFGLILRLQFSMDQLPEENPVRADINKALSQADLMMQEGRERIKHLRASHTESHSLGDVLGHFGHQLQSISPVHFEVAVEGLPRLIDAYVQEEILLIGREAVTNAFRHSGASVIGVQIHYRIHSLQLRVYDNGRGVEKAVLESGRRKDHWGLPNMRERARKIHATLSMELRSKGGTQVELRIPASIAYKSSESLRHRFSFLFRRMQMKEVHFQRTSRDSEHGRPDVQGEQ